MGQQIGRGLRAVEQQLLARIVLAVLYGAIAWRSIGQLETIDRLVKKAERESSIFPPIATATTSRTLLIVVMVTLVAFCVVRAAESSVTRSRFGELRAALPRARGSLQVVRRMRLFDAMRGGTAQLGAAAPPELGDKLQALANDAGTPPSLVRWVGGLALGALAAYCALISTPYSEAVVIGLQSVSTSAAVAAYLVLGQQVVDEKRFSESVRILSESFNSLLSVTPQARRAGASKSDAA